MTPILFKADTVMERPSQVRGLDARNAGNGPAKNAPANVLERRKRWIMDTNGNRRVLEAAKMGRTTKTVTVIPSSINPATKMPVASVGKRKVAAYARVSTDSDEQFTSYEAQIDYYTKYILARPDWTFVKVYTEM